MKKSGFGFGKRRKRTDADEKRRQKGSGSNSSGLKVALECARADLPIVPLQCEQSGRHLQDEIGADDATTEARIIERWWAKWPDAVAGIVIGGTPDIIGVISEGAKGAATTRIARPEQDFQKNDHDQG
jgi:hypothetical protein